MVDVHAKVLADNAGAAGAAAVGMKAELLKKLV